MTEFTKMTIIELVGMASYEKHCSGVLAELERRISVRDRVVRQFMEDGAWHKIEFNHGTTVHTDDDYNPTYYELNGEQIL